MSKVEVKDLEVGKCYKTMHARKGNFNLEIEEIGDEWITGTIIEGEARYIASSNATRDDQLTVRISLCEFESLE